MLAQDLKPGDIFKIDPPDPESPVRICLTNDTHNGIRFSFPNNRRFWCSMGGKCHVEITGGKRRKEVPCNS